MGTGWRVQLAVPRRLDLTVLEHAIAALLARIVAQMSHWQPDSTLGRFNRAAPASWFVLPAEFATVMAAALDVAARSGGAFDPAIGALVDLWGFGPTPSQPVPDQAVPDEAALARACKSGGWRRLTFDPASRALRQPGGLRLDLSGIAKGYAVDRVAALLGDHGVGHALVEIGGEFAGRGLRPDGDPWWVELETPGPAAATGSTIRPLRVALHQLAVATSGDYVRGRHTLDPRTGRPVDHVLAISVIHPSAMLADAWATALGVLDQDAMMALARAETLVVRALLRSNSGLRGNSGLVEWLSPALAAMIAED